MRNLSNCTVRMLHEYHFIYSVWYYPQFIVTAVGLGTYYPRIRGSACTINSTSTECRGLFYFCLYVYPTFLSLREKSRPVKIAALPVCLCVNLPMLTSESVGNFYIW